MPSNENKAEAEKMPEKRADSPASSARCVSQQEHLTEPTFSQKKGLDARLETMLAKWHIEKLRPYYDTRAGQRTQPFCDQPTRRMQREIDRRAKLTE
jgi:hypothetical protein